MDGTVFTQTEQRHMMAEQLWNENGELKKEMRELAATVEAYMSALDEGEKESNPDKWWARAEYLTTLVTKAMRY